VPTTLDELKAAAEALTDKDNEMYGFVARGQRSPAGDAVLQLPLQQRRRLVRR
jgi:ABC-type glycerol-3-phosphate transport system substrate-binding protein